MEKNVSNKRKFQYQITPILLSYLNINVLGIVKDYFVMPRNLPFISELKEQTTSLKWHVDKRRYYTDRWIDIPGRTTRDTKKCKTRLHSSYLFPTSKWGVLYCHS
jgi:hypothetical protein